MWTAPPPLHWNPTNEERPMPEESAPMRGCLYGLLISMPIWLAVGWLVIR